MNRVGFLEGLRRPSGGFGEAIQEGMGRLSGG